MYVYEQATGRLSRDGVTLAFGYSGAGISRNMPDREHIRGEGPIPRGRYMIGPKRFSRTVGACAMYLWPVGHTAHGRSALMLHGDNRTHTASKGCVIIPLYVREQIASEVERSDGPTYLDVV